jgi:toxin ParE1/3/4
VPGLGLRFITEIDRCQKVLLETPLIGHSYGRRLRKFTVGDKFPYSIVYAVLADVLFVLAYAHGSRRPGYWRARSIR